MKRWTSVLAILLMLGGSVVLAACEPPEDMEQDGGDDF